MMFSTRSQGCSGDPRQYHRTEKTKCDISASPCKERQGENRGLEFGPRQDPQYLQRVFRRFRMTIANAAFPDGTGNKYTRGCFRHPRYGLRHPPYDDEK